MIPSEKTSDHLRRLNWASADFIFPETLAMLFVSYDQLQFLVLISVSQPIQGYLRPIVSQIINMRNKIFNSQCLSNSVYSNLYLEDEES